MALNANELYSEVSRIAHPRLRPSPDGTMVAKVGNLTAAPLLPIGTPMAFNTSTLEWMPFTQGGSNDSAVIRGFVYGKTIQVHATDEVLGVIMFRGRVHRDDVNTAAMLVVLTAYAAVTEAELDTALKAATMRTYGLDLDGIAGVH